MSYFKFISVGFIALSYFSVNSFISVFWIESNFADTIDIASPFVLPDTSTP